MGEPVKIIDLARNMIELSGLRPGVDIEIEVVGMRDGETLHEDLFAGDEQPDRTSHGKIFRSASSFSFDADTFLEELETFEQVVFDADQLDVPEDQRLTAPDERQADREHHGQRGRPVEEGGADGRGARDAARRGGWRRHGAVV
jgi:FlaA1/EpsC-like NDP-sugar epimerase